MFKETLKFNQTIIIYYGKQKNHITTKKIEGPIVGYYKGSHIMFEPCGHGLCCQSILWLLAIF
jgi:hypothetical protein